MSAPTDFFSAVASLGAIDRLDVDAMRLLYRIELAGEGFYFTIADRIGHEAAATLLRKNGREERGHAERLRRAIGIKLGVDFQPSAEDQAPLATPLPDAIPVDMLPMIVQGELDGDEGYQRWADREPNAEIERLLRQNGREETVHGQRVQQVIALLRG